MNALSGLSNSALWMAVSWVLLTAVYLGVMLERERRSPNSPLGWQRLARSHLRVFATIAAVYGIFAVTSTTRRDAAAEAAFADLEFETGALSVAERLAAGSASVLMSAFGASSDGSHFSVRFGPDEASLRLDDMSRASCGGVLSGLSRHARSELVLAREIDGGPGSFRPIDSGTRDCPAEGARADLILRRSDRP
jgi:hypothetical protein